MKAVRKILVGSGIGMLLSAPLAIAHHSTVAEYDNKNLSTVTGTVSKIAWANPHVRLYVDVVENGEKKTWDFELSSTNSLLRRGWNRNSVKVGDTITVSDFYKARNGAPRGNARGKISKDGKPLFTDGDGGDE